MNKFLLSGSDLPYMNMVMAPEGGEGGGGAGGSGGEGGEGGQGGEGGEKGGGEGGTPTGRAGEEGHWTEGMPEETINFLAGKGLDKLEKQEALNKTIHSYSELEKKVGAGHDKLIVRPDMDDPEQVERFYKELGRPDEAGAYNKPEGDVDEGFFGGMAEAAFAAGLTSDQMDMMSKAYQTWAGENLEAAQNELQLQQDADVNDLRKDWGSDFDRRVTEAGRFAKESGMPDEIMDLIENQKGSKALLEWTYKMSQATGSGETVNTQTDSHTTPKEAAAQIQSLQNEMSVDPKRLAAYNKGKGADYEKMQKLIQLAASAG